MVEKHADADSFEMRVAREHEQLGPLFEATRAALADGSAVEALPAIARLRNAIETHTSQEDQLYYPALWSLCPQHKDALELFIRSHARFRSDFDEIVQSVTGNDLELAARHFASFSESFATHEIYEEELLRQIDAESPFDVPAPAP